MSFLEIVLGIVIVIGAWYADSKIRGYQFTISELKDENRRLEKNLKITESSKEWLEKLYDDLLEKHELLLGKYNPPPRWWESEDGVKENKTSNEKKERSRIVLTPEDIAENYIYVSWKDPRKLKEETDDTNSTLH
jgi:hypothetical protein